MHRPAILALAALLSAGAAAACRDAPDMSRRESSTASVPAMPAAGVPLTLAEERAARVRDLRYELHFKVPAVAEEPVTGTATLRFRLEDAGRPLALDFAGAGIRGITTDSGRIDAAVGNEHILLPPSTLRRGENTVTIAFESSDLALNRNPEFMYTLFVPARARLAFPCFDQPDLKARYTLTLDVPPGWEAVSNGAEHDRPGDSNGTRRTFAQTEPIPTYLFAFAAGRFSVETAERGGRRFRMLHRETDAGKVSRNTAAIFDLHASSLAWLEQYTGMPYPFGKFDFVLLPSFQFGGMEHPGSIFYNAASLLLDPSATQNQQLGRASLIAHETAHMWFGDLVTMRWFDDVWMKEVFANFMAAKIVNPSFPRINHELRFLYAHYPAAYDVDRTPGTNAIRQRLENLNDAGSLYGAIIYQKAPIVMRQLEAIVTPDGLRDGLREYLGRHAFGNAGWPDLIAILDGRVPDDLAAWSRAWVEEAGRPIVKTVDVRTQGTRTVTLSQADPQPERGLTWSQRLHLAIGQPTRVVTTVVPLDGREATVPLPSLAQAPLFVLPAGGGIGYGDFVLDPASRAYLTSHLADVPDALTRGAALVSLWEEMLGGRIEPAAMFDTLVAAVAREPDELTVQRLLSYAERVFWKFMPAAERESQARGLEAVLRAGLGRAKTPSLKSAWFNGLRDVAHTPATLAWLERVWSQTETVPGLVLAEPDYIILALELAVRGGSSWQQILDAQEGRIANPDRKAQFAFVRPALSADPAVRAAFFERLRETANRGRESWVLQGLDYLHHPLRAAASEQYIRASLDLLPEIQRTGDIFFPKRWIDTTLGGHSSATAARTVQSFLDGLPEDYPARLRRIVLSSADDLFRAAALTKP